MKTKVSRVVVAALLASVAAVSLWFASPQPAAGRQGAWKLDPNAHFAYGGGGFGGGGGGGGPTGPGITSMSPYINDVGVFNIAATASSEDNKVTVSIAKGVTGAMKDGTPVKSISIKPVTDTPAAPADSKIIGLVYEVGPDGATFDPAVSLTFSYDTAALPAGLQEKNLVLARWDAASSKWVEARTTVDTTAHTATISLTSLFGVYGIIAHARPASFTTSGLSISPAEVEAGKTVSISVSVSNTGDLGGTYSITLRINGSTEASKTVSVSGGGSDTATFSVTRTAPGSYAVDVNGSTGSFSIKQPPPPPAASFQAGSISVTPAAVAPGEKVTVSLQVTNNGNAAGTYKATLKIDNSVVETKEVALAAGARQTVSFELVRTEPAVYSVDVGGVSSTFEVKALPAAPRSQTNWYLLAGILAALTALVTALVLWWNNRRKRVPPVPPSV